MNSPQMDFYIIAQVDGQEKHIKVTPLETSDGVPYYSCHVGQKELIQLRKETYGKWEQLWGNLDDKALQNIGLEIQNKTTPP